MVSIQPQRQPHLREVKQLDDSNDKRVVHPVVLPATSLELDRHMDVAVRPADLRACGLHVKGGAIVGKQVVARLGFEDACLRVVETPVCAAVEDFACE